MALAAGTVHVPVRVDVVDALARLVAAREDEQYQLVAQLLTARPRDRRRIRRALIRSCLNAAAARYELRNRTEASR